ncbi:MAG: OB-fold domain-containing protein [Candidatus Thermoplasmatota archaeon]|nr:OB-fold domain-containing protein [Candidatus Thermoplasmatota archaeon]
MAGIASLAFHFPAYSIRAEAYADMWDASRAPGIQEKTVAGYDEDEVTLAVEAARALPLSEHVGFLATATFGGPHLAPTVAVALGMEEAPRGDFRGSTNASGEALLSCLDFVETHHDAAVLVAADAPQGGPEEPAEHPQGAAAAAVFLTPDGDLRIEETATHTQDERGKTDSQGRKRGIEGVELAREIIQTAAREGLEGWGTGQVAAHEPDGRFASRALKGLVDPTRIGGGVVGLSGDTGCVSPLLALAEIVHGARKGDRLGLVTYGGGSSVVLSLRVVSRLSGTRSPLGSLRANRSYLDYATYARYRTFLAGRDPAAEVSQGAYVSLPTYLDSAAARYRLAASRCTACNRLDFPPRLVCLDCGGHDLVQEVLTGKGEVYARTVITRGSSPTEFQEQQDLIGSYAVALVQLQEGPRILTQLTDVDPADVEIGMPVDAVLRRIYRQEGVVRYGYKFRPMPERAASTANA